MVIYVAGTGSLSGKVLKVDTETKTAELFAEFEKLADLYAFVRAWNGDKEPM